ncbi:MAG: hypothetical protein EOO43_15410 [Flavobacterium sp.]|nr:MAG: hypothetical protein EOO43_15410 [Flavobacterium sp.]
MFYTLGPGEKYITGPFTDNQEVETVVQSSSQHWGENGELRSNVQVIWKLGSRYNDPTRGNIVNTPLIVCKKYNEVVLDLTKAIK